MRTGEEGVHELTQLLRRKDLQAAYLNYLRTRLHDTSASLEGMPDFDTMLEHFHSGADPESFAAQIATASTAQSVPRERVVAAVEELQHSVEESERQISALVHTEGSHVNRCVAARTCNLSPLPSHSVLQ